MSGRSPGRRGGRSGRGYQNNPYSNNNNNKNFKLTNKKKTLEEYFFYAGSAKTSIKL
jgi:hypothetical protein